MRALVVLPVFLLSAAIAGAADHRDHVGFQRGRLRYALEAKGTLLKKGTSFEILDEKPQTAIMLDNGYLNTVPKAAIEKSKLCWSVPVQKLKATGTALNLLAPHKVAQGIEYRHSVQLGSRLHLLKIQVDNTSSVEPAVVISPRFRPQSQSKNRWLDIHRVAHRQEASVALSGTFYVCSQKHGGRPLGRVVTDGHVINPPQNFKRARRRASYIWTHSGKHRFLSFEDSVKEQNETRAELGGLGILVKNGDTNYWRNYVSKHFAPSYYSGFTRRPQVLYGTDKLGKTLWVLLQEGRPRSPRPLSLPELAVLLEAIGASDVAFSDGGTTADLLINGRSVVRRGRGCRRELHSTIWVIRPRKKEFTNVYCED